jgi:hypothetical protein
LEPLSAAAVPVSEKQTASIVLAANAQALVAQFVLLEPDGFGIAARIRTRACYAHGLKVLTLAGEKISAITRFDNSVLRASGCPETFPE